MTCSDFLDSFSDWVDGVGSAEYRREADGHLDGCTSCRRYVDVFERGRGLLRSFPDVSVTDDFGPRLRHRIYHIEDGEAISPGSQGSATTAMTALGMALLLVVAAWSPVLLAREPVVDLSPIVVSTPAPRPLGLRAAPTARLGAGSTVLDDAHLWKSNALLFQYSALARQSGRQAVTRAGLD